MPDFLSWSHSRRKTFMECPKKLYHTQVAKRGHPDRVDQETSQAMKDGNEVDNALTERIAAGTPLPEKFRQFEPLAQMVAAAPGAKLTQMKMAFDRAFKPVGYQDWDNAWVRVIYDLAIVNGTVAFIWDWKNGQVWPDNDQLKLFAATGFHAFPEAEIIDTSYVWLRHGVTSDQLYQRRELPDLWADLLPDVERMQAAYKANHWPATPSRSACKWCPVKACASRAQ